MPLVIIVLGWIHTCMHTRSHAHTHAHTQTHIHKHTHGDKSTQKQFQETRRVPGLMQKFLINHTVKFNFSWYSLIYVHLAQLSMFYALIHLCITAMDISGTYTQAHTVKIYDCAHVEFK